MKRFLLLFVSIIPFVISAQNKCVFFEKMVKLEPEKTNLNTSQSDFGPAFVGNELWFSAYTDEEIQKTVMRRKYIITCFLLLPMQRGMSQATKFLNSIS